MKACSRVSIAHGPPTIANRFAAECDFTRRRGDADNCVFRFQVAADELVGLADGDAFDHAGHGFERADINCTGIAR